MKKLYAWLLVLVTVLALVGCGEASAVDESMFVEVERDMCFKVVYHRDTKVMYSVSDGSYNRGTLTLLVDADGEPLLWGD